MTEKTPELLAVEAQHGFTFGSDGSEDTAGAPKAAALVCSNPACKLQNQHIEIHADTILPVHCGNCFTVLHCPHDWTDISITTGTLGAPRTTTYQHCNLCGTDTKPTHTPLPPVNLEDLPIGILQHLQNTATDQPGNTRL